MKTIRTASGQRSMNTALRKALRARGSATGPFVVTYPGGRDEVDGVYFEDVDLWVAFMDLTGSRWWNGFNVGEPGSSGRPEQIAVEVNIPMQETRHRIQGVALEDERGRYWLGHRGRLGGNSASIGAGFLDWYPDGRAVVLDQGQEIEIILIGLVDDPKLPTLLRRFVDMALLYKHGGSAPDLRPGDSFSPEFTGEKSVDVQRDHYVASGLHGVVVQALHDELSGHGVPTFNDRHRDLYVGAANSMAACFEVKTGTSTTDCYTALGQLFLHGGDANHRVFVAPSGALRFAEKMIQHGIKLLRYDVESGRVTFKDLKKLVTAIRGPD